MKNIFKFLIMIVFTQTNFAQSFNANLVSKNAELNLSLEPQMRGLKSENVIYNIENDLQTLSAYENGKLKWQTNVISVCGKPNVGKPEIRHISPKKNKLSIIFGKHSFAEVDIKDGKTKFLGSD